MELKQSTFVKHKLPCPSCGGSDPVSMNNDGSAKCFSCGTFFTDYKNPKGTTTIKKVNNTSYLNAYTGTSGSLTDRNISEKTATKYGVRVVYNSDGSIAEHIYPYYNGNEIVAVKTRYVANKSFRVSGTYEGTGLFGEQLYGKSKLPLTITEGECDAMSVVDLGIKSAVVSIKRGSAGAVRDIRDSIEFVESFDKVIICFEY